MAKRPPQRKPAVRDWKAAYRRRDERAKALGYKSYYDYRAHEHGKLPPSAPRATGAKLRRLRGHASGADLARQARAGALVVATLGGKDGHGRYHRVDVSLIGADGREEEFTLQGAQLRKDYLTQLVEDLEADGVVFSPAPSMDLRRVADDASE